MIPIYINNFNRLTTTRNMVEYLAGVPDALPVIIDNFSTYKPLLKWYSHCPVEAIRMGNNHGPLAPWLFKNLARGADYYVVTDADLDLTGVPTDVLQVLRSGLEKYPRRVKAGLSLETRDLPQHLDSTRIIQEWEARFWKTRIDERWWSANIDTTFAMYRAGEMWRGTGPALRADRPYTARHVPWYRIDTDEESYFSEHADKRWSTWTAWDYENPARKVVLDVLRGKYGG
jgi:hypothetical protein